VTCGIAGFVRGVTFRGKGMAELNMRLATISFNVFFPVLREVAIGIGCCQVSWAALNNILSRGKNLFIIPGGARESIYAHQGTFNILLRHTRGFIRLAMKQGVPLVPVLSFGENDMYRLLETEPGSVLDEVEKTYERFFGFTVPIFYGRVIWNVPTIMPIRNPIHIVVGKPIPVPKFEGIFRSEQGAALVEELYQKYVRGLKSLYYEHEHLWKNKKEGGGLKIL
jgi:2-acylglycerol O-acyltransferase 2